MVLSFVLADWQCHWQWVWLPVRVEHPLIGGRQCRLIGDDRCTLLEAVPSPDCCRTHLCHTARKHILTLCWIPSTKRPFKWVFSPNIARHYKTRVRPFECLPSSTREGNATAAAAVFQPLLADLCTVVLLTFLLTYWRCYLLTPCDRLIYVHSTWRRQLMTSYKLLILCCCWMFLKAKQRFNGSCCNTAVLHQPSEVAAAAAVPREDTFLCNWTDWLFSAAWR